MTTNAKKTRTGWKFDVIVIANHPNSQDVVRMTIRCSGTPEFEKARQKAISHAQTHLVNFARFATPEEVQFLGNTSFSKILPVEELSHVL